LVPRSRRCGVVFGSIKLDMTKAEYARRIENWEAWNDVALEALSKVPA
jgi:hypothetical protein